MKKRPIVVPLVHEPLVDAVNHYPSLLARRFETEIFQDGKRVEGNEVPLLPFPAASRRLDSEKLGSPAFSCDARSLGCNRLRRVTGEVPHDLPTDRRVRIEKPFEIRRSRCIILQTHRLASKLPKHFYL